MTAVSLNYLKFSHIFLQGYGVARKSALTLKFTQVRLVSSQNKIVREREKKNYKECIDVYKSLTHTIVSSKSTTVQLLYIT